MNNPQHKLMRKRFAFATAIAMAIIIIIPFDAFIASSTAVAQQQRINSNTSSSQGTNSSNPSSLNAILIAEILLGTTLGISSPLLFYVWKKERQDILMDLKKNEILQINSSIIIGVLILLTLGYNLTHIHKSGLFTASIIVPFAASSIMIIISQPPETDEKGNIQKSQHKRLKLFPAGIMAMMVGFVYIIAAVITITLIV
jgi:F0F1-type ATP synthase assembly protein I